MKSNSLYERLGGSSGISNLVEDIVARHMENSTIGARFRPYPETPESARPPRSIYARSLKPAAAARRKTREDAHRGMNISEAEYVATRDDILTGSSVTGTRTQSRVTLRADERHLALDRTGNFDARSVLRP